MSSMCAPSAGVVGAPRDVVCDRRGDVEGREAGVLDEPGGVEVGVVARAVLPSGQEVSIFIGPLKPGTYEFHDEYNEDVSKSRLIVK